MGKKRDILPVNSHIKGIYRHYKGGMYRILFVAHHSETLEDMVVYEPLDGATGYWVRPASMWEEVVMVDGREQPRFAFVALDESQI